jgi:hypothetical protein
MPIMEIIGVHSRLSLNGEFCIFGLTSLVGGLAAVAVLAWAGVQTHWSHFLLIASLFIGTAAAAFAWWADGLRIHAAGLARHLVFLLSRAGIMVSALIAAVRAGRRTH